MRVTAGTLLLLALLACPACQQSSPGSTFSTHIWDPFGLMPRLGLEGEPVRVAFIATTNAVLDMRTWWDVRERTPWTGFQRELAGHLGRPVMVEQLQPFQVAVHLEAGRIDFALLTDAQLEEIRKQGDFCRPIARAVNLDRVGLIVASAKSDVSSLADIKGRRFAFGPPGDAVLHYGATAALASAGVTYNSIQRELIPLNSLQFHISSFEVAKEVAYGLTSVGVIDKAEYDSYPDAGGRIFPTSYSKDQFRVLGQTAAVTLGPVVVSNKTDPALADSVKAFLLSVEKDRPAVATALGIQGFTAEPSEPRP